MSNLRIFPERHLSCDSKEAKFIKIGPIVQRLFKIFDGKINATKVENCGMPVHKIAHFFRFWALLILIFQSKTLDSSGTP